MENNEYISKEQKVVWIREQHLAAIKYLAGKGIVDTQVKERLSRYVVPIVSVWHIEDKRQNGYWVISGNIPSDHVNVETAPEAREALRHFSLKWQLQADKLRSSNDEMQRKLGVSLEDKADALYRLFEDEVIWDGT
ncbi:DUF4826 family protein [Thalassotalea euphylliae]|uniref:DUF4826 family protein n=1 Tax=Thalassotalea euphylliae TaxID=1655234 RepID=UPI003626A5DC